MIPFIKTVGFRKEIFYMDNFLNTLGRWIKTFLHFLNNYFNQLSARWQEEQTTKQLFYNSIHWNNVSQMLQDELFLILKNSPYEYFNTMFCSDNINNNGWEIRGNDIVYCFDIYTSTPPTNFVLEQLRQKLNLKIAQYQRMFIQQYGHEQASLLYPCIYYGMYILSMKQDGVMVRFEITTHLSYITP